MMSEEHKDRTHLHRLHTLSAILDDSLDDNDADLEALAQDLARRREADDIRRRELHLQMGACGVGEDESDAKMDAVLAQAASGSFMCVECVTHAAEIFCEQCHDYFCELCWGGQHRKGNRRKHTFQPIVEKEQEHMHTILAPDIDKVGCLI